MTNVRMLRIPIYVLVLGVCVSFCGLLFQITTDDFSDSVPFSGDRWEYQSLGVNLANGRGFRHGAAEDLSGYHFEIVPDRWTRVYHPPDGAAPLPAGDYFLSGAHYSFYRLYPSFQIA